MKKMMKNTKDMMAAGIGIGVGASVLGDIDGTAAANVGKGITNLSAAMPMAGKIVAGGMIMRGVGMMEEAAAPMMKKKRY